MYGPPTTAVAVKNSVHLLRVSYFLVANSNLRHSKAFSMSIWPLETDGTLQLTIDLVSRRRGNGYEWRKKK